MDRTEAQLREKLLDAEFEPDIVEQVIEDVKRAGYQDDERYARNYIEFRQGQKSRRQLIQELQFKKGIPSEVLQKVCQEVELSDEKELIKKQLKKKNYDFSNCDPKERQKLIASLLRRGFCIKDILSVMDDDNNFLDEE